MKSESRGTGGNLEQMAGREFEQHNAERPQVAAELGGAVAVRTQCRIRRRRRRVVDRRWCRNARLISDR
jgi:hypothetical protein